MRKRPVPETNILGYEKYLKAKYLGSKLKAYEAIEQFDKAMAGLKVKKIPTWILTVKSDGSLNL
jgi:hypothetical protein